MLQMCRNPLGPRVPTAFYRFLFDNFTIDTTLREPIILIAVLEARSGED